MIEETLKVAPAPPPASAENFTTSTDVVFDV
jgi:hypothetical protein